MYNNKIKKGKKGNEHMNWQGHDRSEEFHAGYWKRPVKVGSVLFMTDVTVFYVTMLGIVKGHVFLIYVEKHWTSV